ncbi:MAG: MMPL family transporter [Candidatus Dormibacteraceae bacterium]
MSRLMQFPVRHPWVVVIAWIVLVIAAGPIGRLSPVPTAQLQNLPASASSVQAAKTEQHAFGINDSAQTAQVVVADRAGISPEDQQLGLSIADWAREQNGISSVSTPVASPDHQALLINLALWASSAGPDQTVTNLENRLSQVVTPEGTQVGLTGDPVVAHDLTGAALGQGSSSSPNPLRLLVYLLILVILALVFRAPLAVATPLIAIGASLAVSLRLLPAVDYIASLPTSTFSDPFAVAVTVGAGTNYAIFLISRYRQEMARDLNQRAALATAVSQVGHAIFFSAISVVVATALMAVGQLELFRSLGPAVAFSVAIMLAAGLTLMPALMAIFGRALFWPRRAPGSATGGRFWTGIANSVARRPAVSVLVGVAVLAPLALGCLNLAPSFDTVKSLPSSLPSARGYQLLAEHFGVQLSSASVVITGSADLTADPTGLSSMSRALDSIKGVEVAGQPSISAEGRTALIRVVLANPPASEEAMNEVTSIQTTVQSELQYTPAAQDEILVGGAAAANADEQNLLGTDFLVIAILVGFAIYAILSLLLRDLLAPVYLLGSTAASTAAAIGAVAAAYHAAGQPIFWTTPVFAFVFLVALGQDFNILLLSTIRREAASKGTVDGVRSAVASTGGIISSCGVVMAAAFMLLAHSPVLIVQQIGLVVIVGLLLDTFLVRPVLVPGLVTLFGSRSGIRRARIGEAAEVSA